MVVMEKENYIFVTGIHMYIQFDHVTVKPNVLK